MTDDTASIKARLDHIDREVGKLDGKVDMLVEAEAKRRGREEAQKKTESYQHDDRWQVWLRHIVPAGILGGLWAWVIQIWNGGGQ